MKKFRHRQLIFILIYTLASNLAFARDHEFLKINPSLNERDRTENNSPPKIQGRIISATAVLQPVQLYTIVPYSEKELRKFSCTYTTNDSREAMEVARIINSSLIYGPTKKQGRSKENRTAIYLRASDDSELKFSVGENSNEETLSGELSGPAYKSTSVSVDKLFYERIYRWAGTIENSNISTSNEFCRSAIGRTSY